MSKSAKSSSVEHGCERPLRKEIGERPAIVLFGRAAGHPITIFVDAVVAFAVDVP